MKNIAIIPSGGIGSRFNSPIPKQYVKVLGKELIVYTLEIFQKCNLIDEIIIPADKSYFSLLGELKEKYRLTKITQIIEGGKERQDSVKNGLNSKAFDKEDFIIVHDAARPLLSIKLLENALNEAHKFDSIVVAIKARDTLISGNENVTQFLDRSNIYYAQTPQIFKFKILEKAFKIAGENGFLGTDESSVVKSAGFEIKIIEGEFLNFKVTLESDLIIMEKMLINDEKF